MADEPENENAEQPEAEETQAAETPAEEQAEETPRRGAAGCRGGARL